MNPERPLEPIEPSGAFCWACGGTEGLIPVGAEGDAICRVCLRNLIGRHLEFLLLDDVQPVADLTERLLTEQARKRRGTR